MIEAHPSSFKDPDGFVIRFNHSVLRIIGNNYKKEFEHLVTSGLFLELRRENLIIDHQEIREESIEARFGETVYKIIKPTPVTISYPSEWTFSQLKDAALCMLKIQRIAIKYNMILKDCSAYNIQFHNGSPLLIDSLSFRFYENGKPWFAYRQFCEHFFGPLLLIANIDPNLSALFNTYIDGIPLELVNKLLPLKSKISFGVMIHIVLHSRSKSKHRDADVHKINKVFNIRYLNRLTEHLYDQIAKIKWHYSTDWSSYYDRDVGAGYLNFKVDLVSNWLIKHKAKRVLDFGANDGTISRHLTSLGFEVIAMDYDHASVERNYLIIREKGMKFILPLVINAVNPTPSFGWANTERQSFSDRVCVDTILVLALIHHLVIFYNVSFEKVAAYFATITEHLIIEFVPKSDPMVKKLLSRKEDVYESYTKENFEKQFCGHFKLIEHIAIADSERSMYFFKK